MEEQPVTKSDFSIQDPKVYFRIPARMPSVYASHITVQETNDEFILSFFEVIHPIVPGDAPQEYKDEVMKRIDESGLPAECVSRITVAKHRFPGFANVMHKSAEIFVERLEKELGQEADANDQSNNSET